MEAITPQTWLTEEDNTISLSVADIQSKLTEIVQQVHDNLCNRILIFLTVVFVSINRLLDQVHINTHDKVPFS